MEPIQATLTNIRFERDGFLIGMFQSEKGGEFAALGNILNAEIGMEYKLFGKWVNDRQWGQQLKIKTYETIIPKSTDGIYRYIVRIVKWVGPKTGKAIIAKYGIDTLDILREDPERVSTDIKGITRERAFEMQEFIKEYHDIENTLVELERLIGGFGLRSSLPMDAIAKWKSQAVDVLKSNPYRLTEMKQIGFPSADKVALGRFKINPKSVFRQRSAIEHVIKDQTHQHGHIWINKEAAIKEVEMLIGCNPSEGYREAIEKLIIIEVDGLVALRSMAKDETDIADKVKELLR